MSARAEAIAGLFPPEVVVEDAVPSCTEAELFPEEEAAVVKAIEKRRREFAAGRMCVRRAFVVLGVPAVAVPNDDRRAPVWPEGVVGSISHTGDYCAAAVARSAHVRSVGLDVEKDQPVAERLWERICTPDELAWIAERPEERRGWWVRLVFSAKESFYKCQYVVTRKYLGFHDVELRVDESARKWTAELRVEAGEFSRGTSLEGAFVVRDAILATGCFLR